MGGPTVRRTDPPSARTSSAGGDSGADTESLFYLSAGPLAAIGLGLALATVREFTSASNFAFVFMILTITVAEFGGRWAALATAVTSALSLDFFLTEPYLKLTIAGKHDVIAFLGLGACGLVAASFRSYRGRTIAGLAAAQRHLDCLRGAVRELGLRESVEDRLARILRAASSALPIAAAVVRDRREYVMAASDNGASLRALPDEVLTGTGMPDGGLDVSAMPAPGEEGARIPLQVGERKLGWLDVWGTGAPASSASRRLLADLVRVVAALLASEEPEGRKA